MVFKWSDTCNVTFFFSKIFLLKNILYFVVLINIYAIIMINLSHWKQFNHFLHYFSIYAVFHMKIETRPLKSNFFMQISTSWCQQRKKKTCNFMVNETTSCLSRTLEREACAFMPSCFRHNCLLLLDWGFKCIFRHSQRIVCNGLYIFLHYYYIGYYIGFCIINTSQPWTQNAFCYTKHYNSKNLTNMNSNVYQSLILLGLIWFQPHFSVF